MSKPTFENATENKIHLMKFGGNINFWKRKVFRNFSVMHKSC